MLPDSHVLFNIVFTVAVAHSEYLRNVLRPGCTGEMDISPLPKVICALRQLSYNLPVDLAEDLSGVSETTVALCLHHFCAAVIDVFGVFYLREPKLAQITKPEISFRNAGFPVCIACFDFLCWVWKNFPKALQGIIFAKDGHSDIRMEVICDLDLWTWSFQFGLQGSMNYLNTLEVSSHFARVLSR